MSLLSIFLIGFAMSTDAFAAAIGKGAAMQRPRLTEALRAGAIFGVIEGVTPVIGWALGLAAAAYVTAWDHWIAFVLLGILGTRMVVAGFRRDAPEDAGDGAEGRPHGFWNLAATGFATSVDAMAVGVGLAFLEVNILLVASVIGICTFAMVTSGIMLGRALGAIVGKRAEIVGGLILIVIGSVILYEHLSGKGGGIGIG
ncbi:manganese efflux pump MntP [Luteimonas terrae]|uniref:Putative manganese efflux pump MntP n=1 Tax=Luteimonas terrae TaxID=1530191 RepID=A0ABU1XUK7_9GAMM|nr:manganese efflux pump MntP [Luteimonas terrae]MDR7192453.1 putative Mn2+ efflux pump MntP [Luteimonas terrae]